MFQLIVKPGAGKMAQEAYDWYNEQKPGLGDLFLLEFEKGLDKLEVWPEAYNKIKKDYRQFVLQKFPYVIVFKIIKTNVVVYAVFHTSRNPAKKFKKK